MLIHEYDGRIPVYHFDVYRLPSPSAFEDLGASDYWQAGGVCRSSGPIGFATYCRPTPGGSKSSPSTPRRRVRFEPSAAARDVADRLATIL